MPLVSVTRLHLASLRSLPPFLVYSIRSSRQARRTPGFITGWLGNDSEWGFWTSTVWESAEAMRAFRNSDAHLRVMPKLLTWCDEGAVVHWEQQGGRAPDPAVAYERLGREGRVSKVDAPSARQQAGATVGRGMPRRGQSLNAHREGRMKKSLADPRGRASIVDRLQRLAPDSPRRWGRMTSHQAICHLSDSFRSMMGTEPISSVSTLVNRTLVKWIALHTPMPWPHGVRTRPEVDQEIGGTRPVEFWSDKRALEELIDRFAGRTGSDLRPHPIFGRLSTAEWQRWGYLHLDHHLRQFGA
jgi:hypothetical protein